jgi:hypothetical protein
MALDESIREVIDRCRPEWELLRKAFGVFLKRLVCDWPGTRGPRLIAGATKLAAARGAPPREWNRLAAAGGLLRALGGDAADNFARMLVLVPDSDEIAGHVAIVQAAIRARRDVAGFCEVEEVENFDVLAGAMMDLAARDSDFYSCVLMAAADQV